jgi:hypothetical protein
MPCVTQINTTDKVYENTDPFSWLKDELVLNEQAFNLLFAFSLVIGKAVLCGHVIRGDPLDTGPVVRNAHS